ncbi:unnamed protein product [Ceutorhynchus assimilis]|uniref:Uncharacterized protein n=1 Tax=Ceutorhynchus assimilis TaxID=467358 RepID=A0A9N9QRS4_9CUCU|nr:unnamed protein product [Ceutorhynchus assimilis]
MSCNIQYPSRAGGSNIPRRPTVPGPQKARPPTGIPRKPKVWRPKKIPHRGSTSIPRPTAQSSFIPRAENLADSVMEEVGEGEVWNEASAVSMEDFQEASGIGQETGDSSLGILNASQMQDSFECPCDDDSLGILHDSQYEDDSLGGIAHDYYEDSSLGILHDSHYDDSSLGILNESQMQDISMLAESPSNISVYDAEELNGTTAPRNNDWDVPRNRLWQNLAAVLDETEMIEEEDFDSFIANLQNERRRILNDSF